MHLSIVITRQAVKVENTFETTYINSMLVIMKPVIIPPFRCKQVKDLTKIMDHTKRIHITAKVLQRPV